MEGLLPAHLINNVQFLDIVDKWFTRQNIAGLDLMPSTWRQVSPSPKVDQINKHNTVVHHHLRWVVGVLGCCCLLTCFLVDLFFIHFLLTYLLSFADMIFEGVDSDKCFIHITLLVSSIAVLLILTISGAVSTHINIALHVCNGFVPEGVTFLRFALPGVT